MSLFLKEDSVSCMRIPICNGKVLLKNSKHFEKKYCQSDSFTKKYFQDMIKSWRGTNGFAGFVIYFIMKSQKRTEYSLDELMNEL